MGELKDRLELELRIFETIQNITLTRKKVAEGEIRTH